MPKKKDTFLSNNSNICNANQHKNVHTPVRLGFDKNNNSTVFFIIKDDELKL